MEARPRLRKVCIDPDTSRGQGGRPSVRRDHYRSGQHRVTARHRSEWRHLGRALHQTAAVRLQAGPPLSHRVHIMAPNLSIPRLGAWQASRLTKRWSEPAPGVHLYFR